MFRIVQKNVISASAIVIIDGNRTKWNPIRSVIIQVITKSDTICLSRVPLPINHKNYNFRERKNCQVTKERSFVSSNYYIHSV